jgi:DNA-directed RNA polymerase subunit RPC12/RpoP
MPDKLNSQMQGGDFGGRPPAKIATFEIPPDRFVCSVCRAMVSQAARVLPHMSAYVCLNCAAKPENAPIREAEVVNKSFSPWSESEVALLSDYQLSKVFLPFVCNSEHRLIAKSNGFVCPECVGFKVPWAYSWMLCPDWKLMR